MGQATRQPIRCPVSNHRLFDAFWVADVLDLRVVCKCGRLLEVHRDYRVEIVQDYIKQKDHPAS